MTKPNSTFVAVVMDESSSMDPSRDATISGLNEFLTEQKKLDGTCKVTLQKFSSAVPSAVFMDKDVQEVKALTREDYRPGGMTALYDAIGYTIDSLGKRLALMKEEERPSQVVVVIQTDGEENASHQYNLEKIQTMIAHQKAIYKWDFVFLGVGLDAFQAGASFGLDPTKILAYDTKHMDGTFKAVNNYISSSRLYGAENTCFTAQDRAISNGKGA